MVNYAITDWTSTVTTLPAVVAEIETYLETVDNTKTIHGLDVVQIGSSSYQAWVIHNA